MVTSSGSHDGPDTRIRAAIAVLEEADLVFREENLVSVYAVVAQGREVSTPPMRAT